MGVFVTPSIPVVHNRVLIRVNLRAWPPISSPLIYGSRDAVVVDFLITVAQARAQADWDRFTGKKKPTDHYATHGTAIISLGLVCFWHVFRMLGVAGAKCY